MQERIVLIEEPGHLIFSNGGYFLPGTLENALENGGPQKYYRDYCLCQGMVNFNMIDTIGHGIEKIFSEQKRRKCALPEYTINNVMTTNLTALRASGRRDHQSLAVGSHHAVWGGGMNNVNEEGQDR